MHTYIATVHRYLAAYAAPTRPPAPISTGAARSRSLHRGVSAAAPSSPTPAATAASPPPCATPSTQITRRFRPPRPRPVIHSASCWDPQPGTRPATTRTAAPATCSPHTPDTFPTGTDLANGWRIATWLRAHATALHIRYLIWQDRIWSPTTPDRNGWGRPYNGGGIYDPTDATGGHYDHIHVSITT